MPPQTRAKLPYLKWTVLAALVIAAIFLYRTATARPDFDPDKIAEAETRMWVAYYSGERVKLGLGVIGLLRNQYGLSFFEAKDIGALLARSAMKFRTVRGDYDSVVLPDLTEAYRLIKRSSDAKFDHKAAARAELAWWVARRTPRLDSAEQVGRKIGALYGILYGRDDPAFLAAGVFRAVAAQLRDAGGHNADWVRVEALLRKSYLELGKVI